MKINVCLENFLSGLKCASTCKISPSAKRGLLKTSVSRETMRLDDIAHVSKFNGWVETVSE